MGDTESYYNITKKSMYIFIVNPITYRIYFNTTYDLI